MNKNQIRCICIIISTLIIFLLILIVIIIKISNDENNCLNTKINNKDMIKAIGVYHNNNWNSNEATLILNNDMTCKYPNSSDECKWTILDKQITITLTYYMIINNGKEQIPTISNYNNKLECEEDIKKYKVVYNLVNPNCESTKHTHKAILGNNGIILYEHLFNKVG